MSLMMLLLSSPKCQLAASKSATPHMIQSHNLIIFILSRSKVTKFVNLLTSCRCQIYMMQTLD